MTAETLTPRRLVLVKHATPVLDPTVPPREWVLGPDGEAEAMRLGEQLREYMPFRLVASPEPKARRTAAVIAERLGPELHLNTDLREIDRRAHSILSPAAHRLANAGIFTDPERAVVGGEPARAALARFEAGVHAELRRTNGNVVAITHGTVIALFVAAHDDADGFALWSGLQCGAFIVLEAHTLRLVSTPHGGRSS